MLLASHLLPSTLIGSNNVKLRLVMLCVNGENETSKLLHFWPNRVEFCPCFLLHGLPCFLQYLSCVCRCSSHLSAIYAVKTMGSISNVAKTSGTLSGFPWFLQHVSWVPCGFPCFLQQFRWATCGFSCVFCSVSAVSWVPCGANEWAECSSLRRCWRERSAGHRSEKNACCGLPPPLWGAGPG